MKIGIMTRKRVKRLSWDSVVYEKTDNVFSKKIDNDSTVYSVDNSEQFNSDNSEITVHVEADDMINHPAHYNHGKIETIEFIEESLGKDGFVSYCLGNVLKYISRANFKGKHDEDIKKANWYLNRAVEKIEEVEKR